MPPRGHLARLRVDVLDRRVVVGAGAAWFGLYVNSTSTKHEGPVAVPQATGSMPSASASVSTPRAEPVATEDDSLPPPVRRM